MASKRCVVLVVAGTLFAAACGGSGSDSSTRPATTAATGGSTSTVAVGSTDTVASQVTPYSSSVYADSAHWLCLPDRSDDPCHHDLDATTVAADGSGTPDPFTPATDPTVDCFYVYPTISSDPEVNSDLVPGVAENLVAEVQAARFRSVCRLYAPVYRQVTLAGLFGKSSSDAAREIAYGDVADAWHQYLANDNKGRGVVLIGHSQGAGVLTRLIKEQIDPSPSERKLLVSALLIGSPVVVPDGKDVGGDFVHVPLCRTAGQVGCALNYSTFAADAPPPATSFFAKPRSGAGRAGCTNPAALAGGVGQLDSYVGKAGKLVDASLKGSVTTPYLHYTGWASAACVRSGPFDYLAVTLPTDPADVRPHHIDAVPTADWGLHLVDMDLFMGNLLSVVKAQVAAFRR